MTIPLKDFSSYFLENMAIEGQNQIQISSKCFANCIFCSNKQNPFDIMKEDFRSVEEIEKIVWSLPLLDPNIGIVLNESLPGRLSEGEALLHPKIFDILKIIRHKFRNRIDITTNGGLLTEELIEKLKDYLPIKINISIPTINRDYWTQSFNLSEKYFNNAINCIPLLLKYGFYVHPTIVPMPSWIGYENIKHTISFLYSHNIKDILIYAPGYTKYTNDDVISKLEYDKYELADFLQQNSSKYKINFQWSLDPHRELNINIALIIDILSNQSYNNVDKSYWLTSVSAYERFNDLMQRTKRQFYTEVEVIPVENKSYGGNIEVTGLWLIKDIEEKIKELKLKDQHIVMPSNFLDKYGFDLSSKNIVDYIRKSKNHLLFL